MLEPLQTRLPRSLGWPASGTVDQVAQLHWNCRLPLVQRITWPGDEPTVTGSADLVMLDDLAGELLPGRASLGLRYATSGPIGRGKT